MQNTKRLLAIETIISDEKIYSQDALLKKLKVKGINCTQATLSRNLRQLGVNRIQEGKDGYRYVLADRKATSPESGTGLNIVTAIREIIEAKGLVVIKTIPGNANATAYFIDNSGRYEIAGTIAGDDTLLVIPRNGITPGQIHSCLEMIMPGLHKKIEGSENIAKRDKLT